MSRYKPPQGIVLVLLMGLVYLLLPAINHSGDALGYMAEMKQIQESGTMTWSAHHLLYLPFGSMTHAVMGKYLLPLMDWLQAINALAAAVSLWLVYLIRRHQAGAAAASLAVLLAGSAFGVMRFATENETYMLPLMFSLWGSWLLIRRDADMRGLVAGAAMLSLAVLFHQMHIWWMMAAFWYFRRNRRALAVLAGGIAVIALVYVGAAQQARVPWMRFPFQDALGGTVQLIPGADNVKFTVINALRTWLQVHGNVPYFLKASLPLLLMAASGALTLLFSLLPLPFLRRTATDTVKPNERSFGLFRAAMLLHFLWAFYSVGNAEFMVMLPMLLPICGFNTALFPERRQWLAGAGLLLWNAAAALIPNHVFSTDASAQTLERMQTLAGNSDSTWFVARNKVQLENYRSAYPSAPHPQRLLLLTAPADWGPHTATEADISTLLKQGKTLYTDCVQYPEPMSRSSILSGSRNEAFFKQYRLEVADSFAGFYGMIRLYRVQLR